MNSNNIWKWWWWWNLYRDKTPNGTLNDYCGSAIAESLIRGKHIYSFLRETKFSHVYYLNLLFRASNWCCRCNIFWWRTNDPNVQIVACIYSVAKRGSWENSLNINRSLVLFHCSFLLFWCTLLPFKWRKGKAKQH